MREGTEIAEKSAPACFEKKSLRKLIER